MKYVHAHKFLLARGLGVWGYGVLITQCQCIFGYIGKVKKFPALQNTGLVVKIRLYDTPPLNMVKTSVKVPKV